MILMDYFGDMEKTSVSILNTTGTQVDGEFVEGTTAVFTGYCHFFRKGTNVQFLEGKYATVEMAEAIFNPKDLTGITILPSYTLSVAGKTYKVEWPNNVGDFGEVMQVTCYRTGQNG